MTNWLDPAEVRAEVAFAEVANSVWFDRDNFHEQVKQARMSLCVLEAIAALPEPQRAYHDISHEHEGGMACCSEACTEWQLHRIWRIARIVCGKEEGREG